MEAEIRALLQEAGVSFKTNSKSFITTCPRCKKKDKLYLLRGGRKFVCWYCRELDGFQGAPEFALAELCGTTVKEIKKRLYGDESTRPASMFLDLDFHEFGEEDDFVELPRPLKSTAWPLSFLSIDHEAAAPGRLYMEGRGIPVDVALQYGVRYNPSKRRVVFPVQSQDQLYGWQERLIENDKPYWDIARQKTITPLKTITSLDLPRDRVLMYLDRITSDFAVLTEGPFDGLKAHLCGGNVVAMGKAVSDGQLELLRQTGIKRLYLGLDPDAAMEINRIRRAMPDMVIYDLRAPAPFKDLGEMSMEAVKHRFDHAEELHPTAIVLYLKNHFGA